MNGLPFQANEQFMTHANSWVLLTVLNNRDAQFFWLSYLLLNNVLMMLTCFCTLENHCIQENELVLAQCRGDSE